MVLLVIFLVGLIVVGKALGLESYFTKEKIIALVKSAGYFGIVVYVTIFALGELFHIPGMLFVATGVVLYGQVAGAFIGLFGAIASVSVSFLVVRSLGGTALQEVKWKIVVRILERIEDKPIQTVILIRLFTWLAPGANYVLALSPIRFREYLIGSSIGLIIPVLGFAFLFEWFISYLGWTAS